MNTFLCFIISGAMALHATPDYCNQARVKLYDRPEGGILITAGDDGRVVGYTDYGTVDDALQNKNLTDWLKTYCQYIESLQEQGLNNDDVDQLLNRQAQGRRKVPRHATAVEPLVETRWGQTTPYWNLCPVDAQGYNCHTGCVATAMAQVMAYHQWPDISQGTGQFIHPSNGITAYDFGSQPYDWQNMRASYTGSATEQQKEAVALLMLECGAAVNMQYTSFGSAAYVSRVARGLIENMGYSQQARYLRRDWMTSDEWDAAIRTEIEARRPIIFGGQSGSFGHCFVIDGIDQDGLLHVNWGWEGNGDGYFDVNYMFPEGTEATSGFNYTQEIVVGVCPPDADESQHLYQPCLYLKDGLTFSNATPKRTGSFTLTLNNIFNSMGEDFIGQIGVGLFQNGQLLHVLKSAAVTIADLETFERKMLMMSIPADIADGLYELRAVSQCDGQETWTPMATHINTQGVVVVDVAASGLTLNGQQAETLLQVDHLDMVRHRVLPGSEIEVTLGIRNDGDANYNGQLGLALLDEEGNGVWSQVKPLMAYGQRTINTVFTVSVPEAEGMYRFLPAYLDQQTSTTTFFPDNDAIDLSLEVSQEAIYDIQPDLIISDVKHVRKTRSAPYHFSAVVTNNAKDMVKNFTLNYQLDNGTQKQKRFSQKLRAGESALIQLSVSTSTIGKHYFHYAIGSIDGLDDIHPENSTGTTTVKVMGTLYDANVLIEEATGTWCGYCPRGMVAIDAVREQYGDQIIAVAVHGGRDPLVAHSYENFANAYFSSYPICIVNRAAEPVDPTVDNLMQACANSIAAQADAEVSIQKAELSASGRKINTEVGVTLGYNDNEAHYQVAYILLENGVDTDANGNALQQTNFYADGINGPMGGWEQRSDPEPWIYDDVARCVYGETFEGFEGSLPDILSRDVTYTFQKVIDVPDNVLRTTNLFLVALLIDMDTHEVMNAQRVNVINGPTAISEITDTAEGHSAIYDLQGRRVTTPRKKGIYIVGRKKVAW